MPPLIPQILAETLNVLLVNRAMQIMEVTSNIAELTGYTNDELVGQSIHMLVPEESRSQHIVMGQEYCKDPQIRQLGRGRDLFLQKKDGKLCPVEICLVPCQHEGEMYILTILVDITVRQIVDWAKSANPQLQHIADVQAGIAENLKSLEE